MKPRLHPYVSLDNFERVRAQAGRAGHTESTIVDKALTAFFDGRTSEYPQAALERRLDRLTRQFDRLERNDVVISETLALFVRYYLTITPAPPADQMDSARAQGSLRFESFIEQLGRELEAGRRILAKAADAAIAGMAPAEAMAPAEHLNGPAEPEAGQPHA